jgi:hypothetical protein
LLHHVKQFQYLLHTRVEFDSTWLFATVPVLVKFGIISSFATAFAFESAGHSGCRGIPPPASELQCHAEVSLSVQKDSWRQIATYLLFVFGFSSVFYFLVLKAHTLGAAGGLYVLSIMWCPALAGMATLKLNGRNLSELGWKWPATGYAAKSWLIPLLYAFIAYIVVWTTGLRGFPKQEQDGRNVDTVGAATARHLLP